MVPQDDIEEDKQARAIAARAKAHASGERAQAKMRAQKKVFKPRALPLDGMSVHFCGSLSAVQLASCQPVVIQHRMDRCVDRMKAVYFVTSNPGRPLEDETRLVAGLCGGMLVTPEWFCSKGTHGLAVKATPAVALAARRLWISDRFRVDMGHTAGVIGKALLETPGSRWKACSKDVFATAAIKPVPPLSVLALVTTREKERLGVRVRNAMGFSRFLDFVFKLDQAASSMGTA